MSLSGIFARIVALIGAAALLSRRLQGAAPKPAWGSAPVVPVAKPQGAIPTLKMPTARGWTDGQIPVAAPGLKVNAFATGLKHPRWIEVLPNGDVLVAESNQVAGPIRSVFSYAMQATMRRARALGVSANRITLLRDIDGDGVAEKREIFMEGLNQPFGMALLGDTFYVGNTDGVVAFPYVAGADRITAPGLKLVTFKPGGHWTRSLLPSPDGRKLFVGVGSSSNIAENGMAEEEGRAAIYELDLADGTSRIFASGLRNAVGMAWEPTNSGVTQNRTFPRGRFEAVNLAQHNAGSGTVRLAPVTNLRATCHTIAAISASGPTMKPGVSHRRGVPAVNSFCRPD
jgi:glucose/arabinose dehydrogenase